MTAGLRDAAPQTGGVHEAPDPTIQFDQRVHRVDRGAGDIVHHRPLGTHKAVQQRTLADVRFAHQRDAARSPKAGGGLRHRRQRVHDIIEKIGDPAAVDRADRMRLPQAQ